MLSQDQLERAERLVQSLTGEELTKGQTGWLGVLVRALDLGDTYRRLWEGKHRG